MRNNNQLVRNNKRNILKFLLFSLIGIFVFFVPIEIAGNSTIPLDHIVTGLENNFVNIVPIYALIVILIGSIKPFIDKSWNESKVEMTFSILKILGIIVSFLVYIKVGPDWLLNEDMGIFLFESLVIPVGLIVPVGAIFLSFLVDFGFIEFVGILMRPIVRPLFKTPGRSAVDAIASFVGSYSIALLITNKVFKEGKYTIKEASIIATGFSTVSATFMIIVAKTVGVMNKWGLYFWTTIIVTFSVTAIVVRLWPLKNKENEYVTEESYPEQVPEGNIFKNAWESGIEAAGEVQNVWTNILDNLKAGFNMAMSILPTIMSVGLIGLLLANFTPVFDIVAYIFYPFTKLLQIPEAMLAAKAAALGIAEMFLPALLVTEASLITRFVIGVLSVSEILFFSASIPCILSTDIPITIPEILVIWIERTILTLLIVVPFALLIF